MWTGGSLGAVRGDDGLLGWRWLTLVALGLELASYPYLNCVECAGRQSDLGRKSELWNGRNPALRPPPRLRQPAFSRTVSRLLNAPNQESRTVKVAAGSAMR